MKIMWLGQAGYRLTADNGTVIMIDPYLSDSLHLSRGESYRREVPVNEEMLHSRVDIIVITHCHADHLDFATLDILLCGAPVTILAPQNSLQMIRNRYGSKHGYAMFDDGIETILNGIRFSAVYAAHSDERAIGVDIFGDGVVISHTGDTMYHRALKTAHPTGADALLLPVNGWGNNMNPDDAARLTSELKPKRVFPMHWDLFREYGIDVEKFTVLMDGQKETEVVIPPYFTDYPLN